MTRYRRVVRADERAVVPRVRVVAQGLSLAVTAAAHPSSVLRIGFKRNAFAQFVGWLTFAERAFGRLYLSMRAGAGSRGDECGAQDAERRRF